MLLTEKKVSIILPTYCPDIEVKKALNNFLVSLRENTNREDYEFVVVEQGEELVNYGINKPDIYIHEKEPIGYAKAVNLGISKASGDYFVVCNNDLELPKEWLKNLVCDYELLFKSNGLLSAVDFNCEPRIYENTSWYSLWIISREVWEKVGRLDDKELNYRFHDQDYSIRLKLSGFRVGRTGNVIVKHINSATYKKMNRGEDPEEQLVMRRRYGHTLFSEWFKYEGSSLHNSI